MVPVSILKATIETLLALCQKEETVELREDSPVLEIKQNGDLLSLLHPTEFISLKTGHHSRTLYQQCDQSA